MRVRVQSGHVPLKVHAMMFLALEGYRAEEREEGRKRE